MSVIVANEVYCSTKPVITCILDKYLFAICVVG